MENRIFRRLVGSWPLALLLAGGMNYARADYACGPNHATYAVFNAVDGRLAAGVRCVSFVDRRSFTWYGEGQWGSLIYRHLGYAIGPIEVITGPSNEFTGSAADFNGNGESTNNSFNASLRITIPNPPLQPAWNEHNPPIRINVGGAWNEFWMLQRSGTVAGWNSLGPVRSCGSLETFFVNAPTDDDNIRVRGSGDQFWGIRCLLSADSKRPAAWYGEGTWDGINWYHHIGTAFFGVFPSWGAGDICSSGFSVCNSAVGFGGLSLRSARDGASFRVTGAWNEWWDRP